MIVHCISVSLSTLVIARDCDHVKYNRTNTRQLVVLLTLDRVVVHNMMTPLSFSPRDIINDFYVITLCIHPSSSSVCPSAQSFSILSTVVTCICARSHSTFRHRASAQLVNFFHERDYRNYRTCDCSLCDNGRHQLCSAKRTE